jgi:hypothetical protein
MSKPLEMVYIEWVDSAGLHGWHSIEELQSDATPIVIESVGWVITENETAVTLVSHIYKDMPGNGGTRQGADSMTIPKGAIVTRRAARKR